MHHLSRHDLGYLYQKKKKEKVEQNSIKKKNGEEGTIQTSLLFC